MRKYLQCGFTSRLAVLNTNDLAKGERAVKEEKGLLGQKEQKEQRALKPLKEQRAQEERVVKAEKGQKVCHSILNMTVTGLWLMHGDATDRRDMESHIIQRLGSQAPGGTEAPEEDEAEGEAGGVEAFQEKLEDLIEYYRREGMTASIQALMTRFPDVNMTDILIEDLGEAAEGQEGSENMIQGSEQGFVDGGKAGKYAVMQSIVPNMYADYEVFVDGKPLSSKARYSPQQPGTGINPTRVSAPGSPNTLAQGGQAQLVAGSNPGPFSPGRQVSRHSTGMTASATFGVVVGTVLLSWLIVGPAVCVAWRWNERRREGKKILLQRADRGSVDEGIMDAMVMSELGKQSHKKGARRQTEDDVEASLARNRSELQSFPTTTTLESQVM
nr:hypothetical protein BaRGS_000869 [Batillaria attramentaria]